MAQKEGLMSEFDPFKCNRLLLLTQPDITRILQDNFGEERQVSGTPETMPEPGTVCSVFVRAC